MATIEFRDVRKEFGEVTVIPGMSLRIEDGEFVSVLGPSGCGKSTTLFMLAGIYLPTAGELLFDGARVNEVEARDRNVGIVFQSYALYPHMTVFDNIAFPLRFQRASREEIDRRVREAAELVRVEDLLQRRPEQLSGGQQQRVALARALVKAPTLLLLDEPLSNLDATLRLAMRTEIKALQERLRVTTVLVTHDQVEATTMADRIVCMAHGRIEQIGTPDDLYLRPATKFVASFVGSPPINLLEGTATGETLAVGETRLSLRGGAPSGPAVLGIRPEHLQFVESGGMACTIEQVEPMGRETLYVLASPMGDLRVLEGVSGSRYRPGEAVRVAFEPGDALLFEGEGESLIEDVRAATADA